MRVKKFHEFISEGILDKYIKNPLGLETSEVKDIIEYFEKLKTEIKKESFNTMAYSEGTPTLRHYKAQANRFIGEIPIFMSILEFGNKFKEDIKNSKKHNNISYLIRDGIDRFIYIANKMKENANDKNTGMAYNFIKNNKYNTEYYFNAFSKIPTTWNVFTDGQKLEHNEFQAILKSKWNEYIDSLIFMLKTGEEK